MKKIFLILIIVSTYGCDSSSEPKSEPENVELFPNEYFTPGFSKTFVLNGTSTYGRTFEGSVTITTLSESTYNGIPAIPISESFQVLNLQTNETDIHQDIFYYTLPSSDRRLLGIESDLSLRNDGSTSTNAIPDIALSGSTGEIGEYVSVIGKISQRGWSVTSSNNTSSTTFLTEYLNSNNIADIKEIMSYKIDASGNLVSITYIHTLEYIPWTRTLTATPN